MSWMLVPYKRGNRLFCAIWILVGGAVTLNTYEKFGIDWLLILEIAVFSIPILLSFWPTREGWNLGNDIEDLGNYIKSIFGQSKTHTESRDKRVIITPPPKEE